MEFELSQLIAENESLKLQLSEERSRKPREIPVYLDKIIEKPIEVPIEVPVVVDRPVFNQELERHNVALQEENSILLSKLQTI